MWDEYDARCIACGKCNFVCPTCTCFTMQDIYYKENENVGEREEYGHHVKLMDIQIWQEDIPSEKNKGKE